MVTVYKHRSESESQEVCLEGRRTALANLGREGTYVGVDAVLEPPLTLLDGDVIPAHLGINERSVSQFQCAQA